MCLFCFLPFLKRMFEWKIRELIVRFFFSWMLSEKDNSALTMLQWSVVVFGS